MTTNANTRPSEYVPSEVEVEAESVLSFVRRYIPCDCGGWSERFDGVNILSRDIRTVRTSPTSITLQGRENHVRSCPKRPTPPTDMVPAAALADAWDEGYDVGYADQQYRDTGKPVPPNPYRTTEGDLS